MQIQDTTTHCLEWPKSITPPPPTADKEQSNRNSHSLLVRMQNYSATLEDKQFLTNINILLIYNLAIVLLGILPKGAENLYPYKNLHQMFIAALFIMTKT